MHKTFYGLLLLVLLGSGGQALAADYTVTVTVNAEGLRYLRRTFPNLTAEEMRDKVGQLCGQRIKHAAGRDITDRAQKLERKYLSATPAQQEELADGIEALLAN